MLLIIMKNCNSESSNIKMLFFLGKIIFYKFEIFDLSVYNVDWCFIDKYT